MAAEAGRPAAALIARLERAAPEFDFFQAVRLLEACGPVPVGRGGPAATESVRMRASRSLAFPAADVEAVEPAAGPDGRPRHHLTATFLGLYGPDSPLPDHVTEALLHAESGAESEREFLDIFQHHLLSLLFRCWARYRLHLQAGGWGADPVSALVSELAGLPPGGIGDLGPLALLPAAPLLLHRPRGGAGLRQLLGLYLPDVQVEVVEGVERRAVIDPAQRARLGHGGCTLGMDAVLGDSVRDLSGRFRVRVGPVGAEDLDRYQPCGDRMRRIQGLVGAWCVDRLEWDLEVLLPSEEVPPLRLQTRPLGAGLGRDTWLGRPDGARTSLRIVPRAEA